MAQPSTAVLERVATSMQLQAGAITFARRYGAARYAELTTLGAPA
jgi:hypothetical protein